ncbi:MAG: hypothetical protein NVV73_00825 [Cellvibrionaceae bacterium]|nr:hypothetical protein [Cellvibrionaceae bacterium]
MKLSEALKKRKTRHWQCANIRKNPSSPTQWFVMLVDRNQLSHMLVDESDNPITHHDLNHFAEVLKDIGVREFTVFL